MENIRNVESPIYLIGVQFFIDNGSPKLEDAWRYFESVVNEIPNKLESYADGPSYAICQTFENGSINGFTYFIGIPVSNFSNLPSFAVARNVQPGKYAFDMSESKQDIQATYDRLKKEVLADSTLKPGDSFVEVYKPWQDGVEIWQSVQNA